MTQFPGLQGKQIESAKETFLGCLRIRFTDGACLTIRAFVDDLWPDHPELAFNLKHNDEVIFIYPETDNTVDTLAYCN